MDKINELKRKQSENNKLAQHYRRRASKNLSTIKDSPNELYAAVSNLEKDQELIDTQRESLIKLTQRLEIANEKLGKAVSHSSKHLAKKGVAQSTNELQEKAEQIDQKLRILELTLKGING